MQTHDDDDAVRGAAISAFAKANKDIRLPTEAEGFEFLESRRVEQRHGYWVAVTIRVTLGAI
jgi:hypothetical protein